MNRSNRGLAARLRARLFAPLAAAGAAALLGATGLPSIAQAQAVPTFVAVTANNQLLRFGGTTPGTIAATVAITGLPSNETIIGADFRPANGRLYALGNSGRLFTIDTTSGAAVASREAGCPRRGPDANAGRATPRRRG
ncbi:MAG TPA: DUF4394 domain-containing protein [Chloroflexota bacterium]|nr:DUF4394 domain-containing protein [Chloroflexota bacterium]